MSILTEIEDVSFDNIVKISEKRSTWEKNFTIHGKSLKFKTDCPEVGEDVALDLKGFVSNSGVDNAAVYGLLESVSTPSFLRSPPNGSILIWKNLDHSQFHYQLGETIMMYHTKNEKPVAVTLSFISHDASVCFSTDPDALYELCLFEIEKHAAKLLEERGLLLLHSSAAQVGQKGILFPATSGFGKTFLTLVFLNNGHQLLSDDKTFVDPAKAMLYPYSRRLRTDRRSVELFPALRPFLSTGERRFLNYRAKYFIDSEKAWPGSKGEICPLAYIIFPTIWIEKSSRIVPCKPEHALNKLLPAMKLFRQEPSKVQTMAAFELATKIPSFHLMIGTDVDGIEKAIRTEMKL